jgi:hypothetical protein
MAGRYIAVANLSVACSVLIGCSEPAPSQAPKETPEVKAEESLMADTPRAIAALKQRLHARALMHNGLLFLQDQLGVDGLQTFSSIPAWKAECGALGIDLLGKTLRNLLW